jgi:hypothetical protein
MNADFIPTESALRRVPRPAGVFPCADCSAAIGTNYPTCPGCYDAVERYWLADWVHFLAQEGVLPNSVEEHLAAQIAFEEGERHLWTVLNMAMTHLTCSSCGNELGGGPPDCTECSSAWGVSLWAEVVAGRQGLVTFNEHALHIGRMILRFPHRQSTNIVKAWRLTTPRLLTGWLPSTESAQHYMRLVKAGRMAEVEAEIAELDRSLNHDQ